MITDNNGDYVGSDRTSGEFSVPANLEEGVPFVNQTGREVNVSFSAKGEWSLGAITGDDDEHGPHDPNGYPNFAGQKHMKYPDYVAFSLLAVNSAWSTVYQVGVQARLTLPAGATLRFLANDQAGHYGDNRGSVAITWTTDA
jgi:hypothetical protein